MSDVTIETAGGETRIAMLRVWMAISAVWVAFWISLVVIIALAGWLTNPLLEQLHLIALIVAAPPLALLALGTISRCIFEAVSLKLKTR
jgi:hypothetical protein